jgi:hypothetical protein
MSSSRSAAVGDVFALSLSGLCFVHCVVLPPLAVVLPLLGAWAHAEWVHWLFAGLAAPLSMWTLSRPPSSARSAWALALATMGVVLLFSGAAGFPRANLETPLTVMGGLALASAHAINLRRRGGHCHAPPA